LISGKCRHLPQRIAVSMRSIVAMATRFASERASANARKKRPLETPNERLNSAKLTSPIVGETAGRQKAPSFMPVQSFRVTKTTEQATFGITVPCTNAFFLVFTPVTSGLNVILHVDSSALSFATVFQAVKKAISQA
jgi:hypothetical protein